MRKILSIVLATVTMIILASCDSGLEVSGIEVVKYPDKMIYTVSENSKLELNGLEIAVITKDGKKSIERWDDEAVEKNYQVECSADFDKVGKYEVIIKRHTAQCDFMISVVNDNT